MLAIIKNQLSSEALTLYSKVESIFEKKIVLKKDELLGAKLSAWVESGIPVIAYQSINDLSETGIVHELLHLKLLGRGYPVIILKDPDNSNNWRNEIITYINNLFQHSIIFPQMINLGYSPYEMEETPIQNNLVELNNTRDSQYFNCYLFQVRNSMIYARAHFDSKSESIKELANDVFSVKHFSRSKIIGRRIITLINEYAVTNVSKFETGLNKAITSLKQNEYMAISFLNGSDGK